MKEIIDITPMSEEERFWAMLAKAYNMQQAADAKALYALNKQRYKEMQEAYELLKELALESDPEAEVTYGISAVYKERGNVEMICTNFGADTDQMDMFRQVVGLADNFDIMPKTNGTISIIFSFNNVMTKRK